MNFSKFFNFVSNLPNVCIAKKSVVITLALSASGYSLGQDTQSPSLPIPSHPERTPEAPEVTRPRESQPTRESRAALPVQTRNTASGMQVPGRPARGLPPLGEPDSTEAFESFEAPEDPGLFKRLPHSFRDGGLSFEYIYTGETFNKARGGLNTNRPTNYRSNFDLVGIVDTAKMGWWDNGRFFVYGQNLSGRPLSASDVGDVQLFSNLDSTISETGRPQFTAVAEYWYEHLMFDGLIRTKIGKQDANADFALCDLGGDFVNSSFGFPPMIPFPTFPSQALGIASFLTLTEELVFGIAAYDGSLPSGPQGVRWGFDTLGRHGSISLYQLEWKPSWGASEQFPTTVRTGMWHHSDNDVWTEFTADPNPTTFVQNYGTWTTADQIIWKESEAVGEDQGLGIFFQFGWAPGDRNLIQEYYGGGMVYKGLLPSRDSDLLGVAFANALFGSGVRSQNLADGNPMQSNETATEIFYKMQVSPFVSMQPDIQYIANPGGFYRDALLPGMRFEIVF